MKKFAIDRILNLKSSKYNAGDKAHYDASKTLLNCGYQTIVYKESNHKWEIIRKIVRIINVYFLYYKVKDADEVLFQFPGVTSFWLIKKLKKKKVNIVFLLHDVESLRDGACKIREIELFNLADIIISHTDAMKNKLIELGVNSSIKVLYLFDYYVANKDIYNESNWKSVVFAGNLSKSKFLNSLNKNICRIPFYLYGKGSFSNSNTNIFYEGVFLPENISNIKGGWGLVWDGDSIDTCEHSNMGRYLKYNSSHKISLYLVAGKPLIVWEKSSLAEYVRINKLGIVVTSIEDAIFRISEMDKSCYDVFMENVLRYKAKLEAGYFLKTVISQI